MIDLRSASRTILAVDILFLILLGLSFLLLEPGTESYVVGQLALVPVVVTLVLSSLVLYFDWTPFR
jgi:hypothetical protein